MLKSTRFRIVPVCTTRQSDKGTRKRKQSFEHPVMPKKTRVTTIEPDNNQPCWKRQLRELYGSQWEEKGNNIQGAQCVKETEKQDAEQKNISLLYGEILPRGVTHMYAPDVLDIDRAQIVYELGAGLGKLSAQTFLQFPHLTRVVGVEMCESRFESARRTLVKLAQLDGEGGRYPYRFSFVDQRLVITDVKSADQSQRTTRQTRSLELRRQDVLSSIAGIDKADIVICDIRFREIQDARVCRLFNSLQIGCRVLAYEDLESIYARANRSFPFLPIGDDGEVRIATSWQPRGHPFYVYIKCDGTT